jgi:hypothetical protein
MAVGIISSAAAEEGKPGWKIDPQSIGLKAYPKSPFTRTEHLCSLPLRVGYANAMAKLEHLQEMVRLVKRVQLI